MKSIIAYPVVAVMYTLLLITSAISRTMSVVSVTLAAALVNVMLWSESKWLLDMVANHIINKKEENESNRQNP